MEDETVEKVGNKRKSRVWEHFEKIEVEGKKKSKCKYCDHMYARSDSGGTSSLLKHVKTCPQFPVNEMGGRDDVSQMSATGIGEGSNTSSFQFDQAYSRKCLGEMIIAEELPFSFVERKFFRRFIHSLQPSFRFMSRTTIARDCLRIYEMEKDHIKSQMAKISSRISLTTDLWTSNQNMSYCCLTAHFLDDNWRLHKRILNFRRTPSHKGKEVGKIVEQCLLEWGIDRICTLTVDNASSNSGTINYLREKLDEKKFLPLRGEFFHMRCAAHILNLIVKDGLREMDSSVAKIAFVT